MFGAITGLITHKASTDRFEIHSTYYPKNNLPLPICAQGNQPIHYGGDWRNDRKVIAGTTPKITKITPQGFIDDCGTSECIFTVSDSKGRIYTETREFCPIVRIECGKDCPPNTCECVHFGHKCCFDSSTGKLVKKIEL